MVNGQLHPTSLDIPNQGTAKESQLRADRAKAFRGSEQPSLAGSGTLPGRSQQKMRPEEAT